LSLMLQRLYIKSVPGFQRLKNLYFGQEILINKQTRIDNCLLLSLFETLLESQQ
jgi:hypothetical protein